MFSLKEAISSTPQHPKSLRDNKLKRAGGELHPNQLMSAAMNRDDGHDKAFTVRADAASPECRGSVFFAC
jgi:hypothetical protein